MPDAKCQEAVLSPGSWLENADHTREVSNGCSSFRRLHLVKCGHPNIGAHPETALDKCAGIASSSDKWCLVFHYVSPSNANGYDYAQPWRSDTATAIDG